MNVSKAFVNRVMLVTGLVIMVGLATVGANLVSHSPTSRPGLHGGELTMRILRSYTARQIGNQYLESTAHGIYVIVNMAATNGTRRPLSLDVDKLMLKAGNAEYEQDPRSVAALELGGRPGLYVFNLRPTATTSGWLAFDVPSMTLQSSSEVCVGTRVGGPTMSCAHAR